MIRRRCLVPLWALCLASAGFAARSTTLLLQDVPPWQTDSNERVLTQLGVPFEIVGSAQLRTVELRRYTTIVVASDQPQRFYDRLGKHVGAIERWLRHGGQRTLEFHGADSGTQGGVWSFTLPKGVRREDTVYRKRNYVHVADSPLVAGAPSPMLGHWASHVTLDPGTVDRSRAIVVDRDRRPTLLDYCVGPGRVIVSGQTVEYAFRFGGDVAPMLPNMLRESTLQPGCPR